MKNKEQSTIKPPKSLGSIVEAELERLEEEKPIRESNTFYWLEYPKRTLNNQQQNDHQAQ